MGKDLKGKELGEGLCQIKDGRYLGRYTDRYGKRKNIYGHKLKEVKEKLNKAIYKKNMGNDIGVGKKITVKELYQMWFDDKVSVVKPSTLGTYENLFYKHILPQIGDCQIANVTRVMLQTLFNDLKKTRSAVTVNKYRGTVRDMFQYAVRQEFILGNPCEYVTITQSQSEKAKCAEKRQNKFLTEEQIRKLLNFAETKKRKHLDLYKLVLLTGMRTGEALSLTWEDIDFDNDVINISKTFSRVQSKNIHMVIYDQIPKTQAAIRQIPLCDTAKEVLEHHKSSKYTSDTLVFTKSNGQGYKTASPSLGLKSLIEAYNDNELLLSFKEDREPELIPENSLHALRHTFASRCFENDITPKVVQSYMGHSAIAVTMDLYTHVSRVRLQSDIQKINNTL